MKLIAVILSIITLTLSAIPCDDAGVFESEQSISISQDSSQTGHNDMDLCSPFCSCVCCSNIVLEPSIYQNSSISKIPTNKISTFYVASFNSNYLSLIYQPPQV